MPNDKDIKTIMKILKLKKRSDLASLLDGSYSELDVSSQFGSRLNSQITAFLIFSPLDNYYKLKALKKRDYKILLDAAIDIYPIADNSPEVTSLEFRIQQEETEHQEIGDLTFSEIGIKVFVSYSHKDGVLVGELKSVLENFGLNVFLAHEDIKPTSEWQDRIFSELLNCDVFIPILTLEFKESDWTGQETGIAYRGKKLIIPLRIKIDPFGFIAKYQALNCKEDDLRSTCNNIIDVIIERGGKDKLIESLIKGLTQSRTFANANKTASYLKRFQNSLSFEQIIEIVRGGISNNQVYGGNASAPFIRELLLNNKDRLKEIIASLKEDLREHFSADEFKQIDDEYIIKMIKSTFEINLR